MSEYSSFLSRAEAKASDEAHRLKIARAISTYEAAVAATKAGQFLDWQAARERAAAIKDYALENLAVLLEQFEANFTAHGGKVFWAATANDATNYVLQLAQQRGAKKIVKSKSMTAEEINLNEKLEHAGIGVCESDLGELIVQLAEEKPYHIVTPAMHKTKAEISRIFQEKLGAPPSESAEELTMIARRHLRRDYVTADLGLTGANFIIADVGAISMTENEGNGRLTMSCPPVHVVIAGLEKVIPRLTDLSLFLPLLATSGTGQEITCYNSLVFGPRRQDENDGPEEMHVILLDNGRSQLYHRPNFRQALRCIRCGACLNACPVFRVIGGHAYNATYQGPIGAVITPHYNGLPQYQHLAFASSLCGACSDVCPVRIDLHHLILENRMEAIRRTRQNLFWRIAMKMYVWLMRSRWRLNFGRSLARLANPLLILFGKNTLPRLADKTFSELWEEKI
ncbi:MAG: LutB/LldF family L-lactate oxidation iron-sulfur protein [candidate division KSB1 bacterium]|nr:LutB/LldF family L-lactate oxidation iron-sulfur protein [candidate division KSB1 bacterium]MDZ7365546.1 LutB/LldF family L-lactate oxidation iron-sulfur protein [candidate division KSB1 bacterium]MDZ7403649.1 LutB/LldF family L-lactate oxidation iron-sulfur protein [candidate division KSB1 bacterium]